MSLKRSLSLAAALAFLAGGAHAQISDGVIKIGVLSDMSSLYSDLDGVGSVTAAQMAVEDFGAAKKGMKVEIVSADHQNKPDVGSAIARQWYDVDKVDVIVDVPTSSVALAVNQVTRDKGKVFLVSGAASSDLTDRSRDAATGSDLPLSVSGSTGSSSARSLSARAVSSPTSTSPGCADASRR